MPIPIIGPLRNSIRPTRNSFRGSGVPVLDRLHAKEAIRTNADHKEYKNEVSGGSIIVANTNRVGGPRNVRNVRGKASQGAVLTNSQSNVRPFGGGAVNTVEGISNAIKIPISLTKRKENRNNIKLVL